MSKKKDKIKLEIKPNAYGFGHDWFLNVNGKIFMLGQDCKVTSRILGMRFEDAVGYYTLKAKSRDFDKVSPFIVEDLIEALGGLAFINEAKEWELSCQ
jgi:hypothetical protein